MKLLSKENEINKLIRDQKVRGNREYILFISMWDKVSTNIMNALGKMSPKLSLNVVNSFEAPHSFVIWGVRKTPSLVILDGRGRDKKILVTDHVTDIYKRLRLEK